MIFVLDVGNTNTVLGVYNNDQLIYEWRMGTHKQKTGDEYGMEIKSMLQHDGLYFGDFSGIIISSVVPPVMYALEEMSRKYFGIEPMIVGNGSVKTNLKIDYPNPKEIGADRIVNAVGGIKSYGAPLIIIDFGTATTFCYINENESYEGGIISPGINISTEALYTKAAKLPRIELTRPNSVIGKSTVGAMQSGVYFGYVGQVDALVARMREEVGRDPVVIATGGLSKLIGKGSRMIDHVDEFLTLKGLYEIYKYNKGNDH